ncbi:restriction endonuclease subunit S [Bacillus paralicheniformis]|uniref:restriction endonuclease subunit S n=1 Tax=Bacillus paralicheniformis TaxID=1648923 RepID=UPI0011A74144|nr:restriction endonuclease subunit S [Bacillus paralicheniformis]MCU4666999.1 restriction endonuclease subunit S [Bacillus paralicheniformis]MEC1822317.1 restriction endonuclease subunit S [Bacillus paralicheniformis]TWK27995.1 Type-1 restriction enzyme EcoKI specificity protein [Bacillus paralicheniformis]TWK86917.1 Type-1 restriction enzyme EcoKI specificity protein [Bacillus paralicheniformis]
MNAEDLKNSILQLAIQGKLVEQREEEGTAQELIEQIKEEKDKLIKAGKIPKERNLPIISEEEKIFELPNNWQYVRVQDIASYITDYVANGSFATLKKNTKTFKTKNYALFVRTMDLTSNFKGECSYIDKSSYDFLGKSKLYGGELILPNIGGSIGKAFLMPDMNMPMSLAPNSIMIKFLYPIMNKFFSFVIQSPYGATFLRNTKGGTATPKFSKTELRNMVILLPPLGEIVRIVAKIEELMPYVDKYDQAYSEVEELNKKFPEDMQKSILQYAIQGKLVEQREEEGTAEELFQKIQEEKKKLVKEGKIKKTKALPVITEDEIPFDIPDNWKWVRLGEVFDIIMGQSPKGTSVFEGNEGIEFHQGKVFFGEDYLQNSNQSTNKPTKVVEPNTVLLCVRAPVGIVNITERKICIGRGLCGINTLVGIDPKFVMHTLRAFKNEFIKKATGTTFVAITGEVVKNQLYPLPPLEEQKRIVAKIEELLPYTKKLVK